MTPFPGMTKRPHGGEHMAEAFQSFLLWAGMSKVMLSEHMEYVAEGGELSFNDWLVVHHWGEEE